MTKGWKSESARHSLASKGIKTGRKTMKNMSDKQFEKWREQVYLTSEYNEDYEGSETDVRTRKDWAKDKAYDDVLNREDVEESIEEEPAWEVSRQRGFADKPDHYSLEKDGEFLTDVYGNNITFETYEEAKKYIEDKVI